MYITVEKGDDVKFKAEIFLLLAAIALFAASTFVYSGGVALGYLYKTYAFSLVGCGSVLMVTASISYSKRSKKSV
jgi:hypothetical protein